MKDSRRIGGGSGAGADGGGAGGVVGKRTRTQRMLFGTTRTRKGDGMTGDGPQPQPQMPVVGGGSVEDPLGGGNGSVQNGPGTTRTTVTITESTAAPLTFDAKDYRELYGKVSARVGKEAGSVTRSGADITTGAPDDAGNVPTAVIKYDLATMLPEWTQKGSQPPEDQAKFNAWRTSVAEHEKGHRDIYKRELAKARTQVIGPKSSDIDAQIAAVESAAETAQDAWDAAGQPAPLAAPGGIEKVPNATGPQADAGGPGDGGGGGGAGGPADGGTATV